MRHILYDTGIYVDYLRGGQLAAAVETATATGFVHLSSVVAHELVVGAPDRSALRFLERLVERFDGVGRLAVPARLDWLRAAYAIREVALQHDYEAVGRARLTNDALILATALRIGATVVTRNTADFALLRPHLAATVVDVRP